MGLGFHLGLLLTTLKKTKSMTERIPGCICELSAETGEPVVIGYGMCPIHKPFFMANWKLFSWYYKDSPDWEAINAFTNDWEVAAKMYDIPSCSDLWWVVVADKPLTTEELSHIKSIQ